MTTQTKTKKGRTTSKKIKEEEAPRDFDKPNVPIEYLIRNYQQKIVRAESESAEWQAIADNYKDELQAALEELRKARVELDSLMGEGNGKENGKSNNKQSRKVREGR